MASFIHVSIQDDLNAIVIPEAYVPGQFFGSNQIGISTFVICDSCPAGHCHCHGDGHDYLTKGGTHQSSNCTALRKINGARWALDADQRTAGILQEGTGFLFGFLTNTL